jgi:hypothetical protein
VAADRRVAAGRTLFTLAGDAPFPAVNVTFLIDPEDIRRLMRRVRGINGWPACESMLPAGN